MAAASWACSSTAASHDDDDASPPGAGGVTADGGGRPAEGGQLSSGEGGSTAAPALVRFFDDFYPALLHPDYCLGVDGVWAGPIYAGNYGLNGSGWGGFQGLTPYGRAIPGNYMLRIVSQYSDTCDAAIAGFPDLTVPAPLVSGAAYTIAVSGDFDADAGAPPTVRMWTDELAADDAPGHLRVIHLAEKQGALDLARINVDTPPGDGQKPVPLFTHVTFGAFGNAPATGGAAGTSDALGYVTIPTGSDPDFYFYYSLPVYPAGGDADNPITRLKYTDPAVLLGNWTLFLVSHPDPDPAHDGSLVPSLCRDDGSLTGSQCE